MRLYYSGIGVNQEAFNGPDMPKPVDLMLTYADMDSGQRVWAFSDLCAEREIPCTMKRKVQDDGDKDTA